MEKIIFIGVLAGILMFAMDSKLNNNRAYLAIESQNKPMDFYTDQEQNALDKLLEK